MTRFTTCVFLEQIAPSLVSKHFSRLIEHCRILLINTAFFCQYFGTEKNKFQDNRNAIAQKCENENVEGLEDAATNEAALEPNDKEIESMDTAPIEETT